MVPRHHPIDVSLFSVFQNSAPIQKLLIIALAIACVTAVVLALTKISSSRRPKDGSAFLSGLRLGGPILGLLGACRAAYGISVGLAYSPGPITLQMLAHCLHCRVGKKLG